LWIDEAFWHFLFAADLILIMFVFRPTFKQHRYAYMHTGTPTCTQVCLHTHRYTYMHTGMPTCTQVHLHAHLHTHRYTYIRDLPNFVFGAEKDNCFIFWCFIFRPKNNFTLSVFFIFRSRKSYFRP